METAQGPLGTCYTRLRWHSGTFGRWRRIRPTSWLWWLPCGQASPRSFRNSFRSAKFPGGITCDQLGLSELVEGVGRFHYWLESTTVSAAHS